MLALWSPASAAMRGWKLGNGLRVVLKEDHAFPTIALNVVVRAAPRWEAPEQSGISHLLEHMVFKGTTTRGKGQLQRDVESFGGVINAGTSRDFTHFYVQAGSRFLPEAVDVLFDAVAHPALDPDELVLERRVVEEEAKFVGEDPAKQLWELAYQHCFQSHPYRRPMGGTPETLAKITRDDLVAYHRACYTPGNMSVVLVGDFDADTAMRLLNQTFGRLRAGPARPPVASEPPSAGRRVEKAGPGPRTHLLLAFPAPGADRWEDVPATDLLLALLSTGYNSRLNQLQQQHADLLSDLRAEYLTQANRGLFGIFATCPSGAADQVRALLLEAVGALRQRPVPADELGTAQSLLCSQFAFANESFADQADTLGFLEAIGSYKLAVGYPAAVRAVTPAALQAVAGRYLDPAAATLVVLHPKP